MKKSAFLIAFALMPLAAAYGQDAPQPNPPISVPVTSPPADAPAAPDAPAPTPQAPQGGMVLTLRGLDKITGRPTNITAPIGKPVTFATLTITARYCYSTPPSETPETAAFVQIEDHRADQPAKPVFSGWMYASSPGLNGMEHPLYDVWVINCNSSGAVAAPTVSASTAPTKVAAPEVNDKDANTSVLPADAGK